MVGTAAHIHSDTGMDFTFRGEDRDATLQRGDRDEVSGAVIQVFRTAGDELQVEVLGRSWEQRAHVLVRGNPDSEGALSTDVDLYADRIRLLPYLVPADVLAVHLNRSRLYRVFASGAGDGLLLAEGHVELRQIDADGSLIGLARGVRLWMRTDGSSGILRGSPAEVVQHGSDGRVGIARSL